MIALWDWMTMNERFLKIDDAAKIIDVSSWTIRRWIKERKIRTYRFGGSIRIKYSDLILFAEVTPSRSDMEELIVNSK